MTQAKKTLHLSNKNLDVFLGKMTLADQARLLCGTHFCTFGGFDTEAGYIPEIRIQDGGTGINYSHLLNHPLFYTEEIQKEYREEELDRVCHHFYEKEVLTEHEQTLQQKLNQMLRELREGISCAPGCYPPGILLGATWNPKVVYDTGVALGMESSVFHIGVLLGTPNVNILREPVNGRFFEGYSEDPFLARSLAPEMCKGVESMGIAANVKHFACNNLEINRSLMNEIISIRALREVYLPAFEACSHVVSTLMSAYVSINGKHCHENQWLLHDVLRKEWGFQGMTVTDWGACQQKAGDAVSCGQDLFMPGPYDPSDIVQAVEEGRLSRQDLSTAAKRVLEMISRCQDVRKPEALTTSTYRKRGDRAAYQAAAEGIVMLKNDGHLPLSTTADIVFFGRDDLQDYGKGSAQVCTDRHEHLSSTLSRILGSAHIHANDFEFFREGATAIVIETIDSSEGSDRPNLKMNPKTVATIQELAANRGHGKICLILNVPGPVELDGLENLVDSIFVVFYPGMMGAKVMADMLTGRLNPSGALPCTFPVRYQDSPSYLCYPDNLTCLYGEGIYVGYKGYQKRGIKPLFPFGFGLSYSRFEIGSPHTSYRSGRITVTCHVKNQSAIHGKTILQVYVSKAVPRTARAKLELVGFKKSLIKAGLTTKIAITFDKQDLAYFDEEYNKFLVENGKYEVFLSTQGCEDLVPAGSIYISDGSEELRCGPNWNLRQISAFPLLKEAIRKDCETLGLSFLAFEDNAIYVPSMKLHELYPDDVAAFKHFQRAANAFRED